MGPSGRVDPDDPELAELTLLGAAIAISELQAPHEGLAGRLVELAATPAVPLHRDHYLAAALAPRYDCFGAWHGTFLVAGRSLTLQPP